MIKKIDGHMHMKYDGIKDTFGDTLIADGKEMKAFMEQNQVEAGIIMSMNETYSDKGYMIEACALANKYDNVFYWFCSVDPEKETDMVDRLRYYKSLGTRGVGEFAYNARIDAPKIQNVFKACEEAELPILFHMSPQEGYNYGIVDLPGLPLLENALQQFPNLILVGHSQPFWYEISGDLPQDIKSRNSYPGDKIKPGGRILQLLDNYPNLYCDLSAYSGFNAVTRDSDFGWKFIEKYHTRLLYGTDMVSPDRHIPLDDWLDQAYQTGKISEEAYFNVCRGNAIKLYHLDI